MFELAMASFSADQNPAIRFEQFDHLANLHEATLSRQSFYEAVERRFVCKRPNGLPLSRERD